jgi:hypothetical protein
MHFQVFKERLRASMLAGCQLEQGIASPAKRDRNDEMKEDCFDPARAGARNDDYKENVT